MKLLQTNNADFSIPLLDNNSEQLLMVKQWKKVSLYLLLALITTHNMNWHRYSSRALTCEATFRFDLIGQLSISFCTKYPLPTTVAIILKCTARDCNR